MQEHRLTKFNHDKLTKIIQALEVDDELTATLEDKIDTDILECLIEKKEYVAAVQFLAHGLPKREAIWWSYLCANNAEAEKRKTDEKTDATLQVTHDWVHKPSETLRKQANVHAESLDLYTPASWSAMAVYWSGGSIAPENQEPVEPSEFMAGEAVTNAIQMAASLSNDASTTYQDYLKKGLHIAKGGSGRI